MKEYVFILLLFSFLFSCENEDVKRENSSAVEIELARKNLSTNSLATYSFAELTNSAIGYDDNGTIKLGVPNEKILETFFWFSRLHSSKLTPKSFEIVEIDGLNYLRFYSENDIVSTIALIKNENDQYITGSTVCESVRCASGGGCIPDGLYCTKCEINGIPGDCKRTTTSVPTPID